MQPRHLLLAGGCALLVAGMSVAGVVTHAPTHRCHSYNGLPDRECTPGALNSAVTQETIHTTICVVGWTVTVRPSTSYTNRLKVIGIREYGLSGSLRSYEEDHLISLELGGSPDDPLNLWPERWNGKTGARAKDAIETALHKRVCSDELTLAEAQQRIQKNWETAGR